MQNVQTLNPVAPSGGPTEKNLQRLQNGMDHSAVATQEAQGAMRDYLRFNLATLGAKTSQAQEALAQHAADVLGNAETARDNANIDIELHCHGILARALTSIQDYGIEMPPPNEIVATEGIQPPHGKGKPPHTLPHPKCAARMLCIGGRFILEVQPGCNPLLEYRLWNCPGIGYCWFPAGAFGPQLPQGCISTGVTVSGEYLCNCQGCDFGPCDEPPIEPGTKKLRLPVDTLPPGDVVLPGEVQPPSSAGPPHADRAGKWSCNQAFHPGFGWVGCFQFDQHGNPPWPLTEEDVHGIYDTYAECLAACAGVQPPPEQHRGPGWYCVVQVAGGRRHCQHFPAIGPDDTPDWQFLGPYPYEFMCQALCQNPVVHPQPPVPPPCTPGVDCPPPPVEPPPGATCPAPDPCLPPKAPIGEPPPKGSLPSWCSLDVCQIVNDWIAAFDEASCGSFATLVGWRDCQGQPTRPGWFSAPDVGFPFDQLNTMAASVFRGLCDAVDWVAGLIPSTPNCDFKQLIPVKVMQVIVGVLGKYLGDGFADWQTTLNYFAGYACPTIIPSVGMADAAYLAGEINSDLWRCWVRGNNVCDLPHEPIMRAGRTRPQVEQLLQLRLRGYLDDNGLRTEMRKRGVIESGDAESFAEFLKSLPSLGELTQFAHQGTFNPDIVQYFGLLDGMPQFYKEWSDKLGYGYDIRGGDFGGVDGVPATWAQAHWAASWQLPGTVFAFEALHRLRPTGGKAGGPRDPSGAVFLPADLSTYLTLNRIPAKVQGAMTALSYRPVGIRYLRQFAQFGLMKEAELGEAFQDLGYGAENAALEAKLLIKQERSRRYKQALSGARARVIKAYKTGILPRNQTVVALYRLTIEDPDALDAFNALAPAAQLNLASSFPGILFELQAIDADVASGLVSTALTATRNLFFKGRLTADQVQARLSALGITDERAQQYRDLWALQFSPARKELATSNILKYYREGLLNASDASERLANLGWVPSDVPYLLADMDIAIAKDQARVQAKLEREQAASVKAVEEAARRAKAQHRQAVADLAKQASRADLERYVVEDLISPVDMFAGLKALDWNDTDAGLAVADALIKWHKTHPGAAGP